jgi:hypothetical protein
VRGLASWFVSGLSRGFCVIKVIVIDVLEVIIIVIIVSIEWRNQRVIAPVLFE